MKFKFCPKIKDVRPKSGTVVNLKPYSGMPRLKRTWRKTSRVEFQVKEQAIDAMREYLREID